jgi:hypothetical protein
VSVQDRGRDGAADPGLAERYGAPSGRGRTVAAVVVGLVGATFLAWVAWVTWFHGTPQVTSELVGWEVTGEHAATATVDVSLADGVDATCRLQARADDHAVVGAVAFTPVDGRNTVQVRTERRASAVEQIGCTAPGQERPR